MGCNPPYNFIASKTFINPYNSNASVTITGGADDDALLTYNGTSLWLRSNSPTTPSCTAGNFSYTFIVGANQSFTLAGYDILGYCGGVQACATFTAL